MLEIGEYVRVPAAEERYRVQRAVVVGFMHDGDVEIEWPNGTITALPTEAVESDEAART